MCFSSADVSIVILCFIKIVSVSAPNIEYHLGSSSEPKDSLFTIINEKVKQQIITFKKLEPASVWHFGLEKDHY